MRNTLIYIIDIATWLICLFSFLSIFTTSVLTFSAIGLGVYAVILNVVLKKLI